VYVHGYDAREGMRLYDQAATLTRLLHNGTSYPAGATVLEAGCGVGAQTIPLARNSPGAHLTSIDMSAASLAQARFVVQAAGLSNVTFLRADIYDLPFARESFDHVFVCFVLEHLDRPLAALEALKRVLKPGGTLTVIEGDHGSANFYPESEAARRAIHCLVELQKRAGGDALIGRRLYPLLLEAEFDDVVVSPRMVYVDSGKPHLVDGFTHRTFIAMIRGVRKEAIAHGLIDAAGFDRGIDDLYRTTWADGVFYYTFFKAVCVK
jgi:SAM-dependent methyltransferase